MVEKVLLTLPEVCESLGLGRSKIYQLLATGALRPIRIGKSVRFRTDEIERFVRTLEERQAAEIEA